MPKRKRRPTAKQPGRTAGALNRLARERDQVLREFAGWRSSMDPGLEAERAASSVRMLVELKAQHLDSPEIGLWSTALIDELLTVVVPRRVAQRREDSMAMAGDLSEFFGFLERTGRWELRSISVGSAQEHLRDIEFAVIEAADDPSRRGMSGNILHLAVEHGVSLEDQEDLEDFMAWYNGLPQAERVSVSDTGRLRDESYAYRPGAGRGAGSALRPPGTGEGRFARTEVSYDDSGADVFEGYIEFDERIEDGSGASRDEELENPEHLPFWPWYLEGGMDRRIDEVPSGEEFRQQVVAAARGNTSVQRAFALLDVIGESSRITATDALNRADMNAVLARCGLEETKRSMWDVPEVSDPYRTLLVMGALEMHGGRVVPTETTLAVLADPEDGELRRELRLQLLVIRLIRSLVQERAAPDLLGAHDIAAAVLFAAQPEGLEVPIVRATSPLAQEMAARVGRDPDELSYQLIMLRAEFDRLVAVGVLEKDGETFRADPSVRLAVYAALEHVMTVRGEL